MKYDLLIRNGTVVREDRVARADVAVSDEKIVELAPDLPGDARETIDAVGLHVFPGVIDPHVHFNEPGRTEWEGFATGSAALAAGGGTLFFDMPLNSSPPVLDGLSFDLKLEAAKRSSLTDFALWGGLTPTNLDRMEELAERGVVGFKAFMCDSGIEEFPHCDDYTLFRGMQIAAQRGLPVAVHAENDAITRGLTRDAIAAGRLAASDFVDSRPVAAEVEAIRRAISFAEHTDCSLHIVHTSSAEGESAADAGGIYADVSHEVCPHHLVFTAADLARLGAIAKCAPPLRGERDCQWLWDSLGNTRIDFVASDHSPTSPDMKRGPDFFAAWGGIAGVQSTLSVLLAEGTLKQNFPLERVAEITSIRAASRFRIPHKGGIALEHDADLALVDFGRQTTLQPDDLFYRHKISPYVGMEIHGMVRRTILRGRTIFMDDRTVGPPSGKFVRPAR